MANVEKFNKTNVNKIFEHTYREYEYSEDYMADPKHSFINYNLTYQNYSVSGYDPRKRLKELKEKNVVRNKTTVLMFDWVIQKPDNCDIEDTEFFATLLEALKDRYGEDNLLGDMVHMDEPNGKRHMHAMFAPCKDGQFNAKAILTKKKLSEFHDYLNKYFKGLVYEVDFHADDYEERKKRNEQAKETRKKAIKQYKTVEELREESANAVADEIAHNENEIEDIKADHEKKKKKLIADQKEEYAKKCDELDNKRKQALEEYKKSNDNLLEKQKRQADQEYSEKLKKAGLSKDFGIMENWEKT